MSTSSNNLPLQIQKLLAGKGWKWPPDEKLKKQIREAMRRAIVVVFVSKKRIYQLEFEVLSIFAEKWQWYQFIADL